MVLSFCLKICKNGRLQIKRGVNIKFMIVFRLILGAFLSYTYVGLS